MFATSSQRERRGNRFTIVAVAEGIKWPPELRQIAHGGPVGIWLAKQFPRSPTRKCGAAVGPSSAGRSAVGLPDYSHPESGKQIREKLDALGNELGPH